MYTCREIIAAIVSKNIYHAKWLNTLSMLSNNGFRRMAIGQNSIFLNESILKHAANKSRHAYQFKKLIGKIDGAFLPNFEQEYLIAPIESRQYLKILDVFTCRYLTSHLELKNSKLKDGAYLLIAHVLSIRANELLSVYQETLEQTESKVSIRPVVSDEMEFQEEMIIQLNEFSSDWSIHALAISTFEKKIFNNWMRSISKHLHLLNRNLIVETFQ